ncbi:MAG: prepilin peptidase [Candidatus Omnitrophica bacterium]|nr:prepilin peptidase [Candidatus Omnitrophota bacterium]
MITEVETLTKILAIAGVFAAAIFDIRIRKIPNALTFSLAFLGLILNFLAFGLNGLGQSALGLACGILFLYFPFSWGGVGGGDVKLMGAIGSLVGPSLILKIFLAGAIFGGIFSIFEMIRRKSVRRSLENLKAKMVCFALTRSMPHETAESEIQSATIPYACAIGCGTLFVLFVLKGG